MATHVGKEGLVKVGANTVAEVNGWELEESGDVEATEDTELSDEWKTFKSGTDVVKEFTATIECWWDETDTNGQQALTVGASVTLNLYPEAAGAGATYQTGTAIVQSRSMAITKNGITTRTINLKGSGALTETTV